MLQAIETVLCRRFAASLRAEVLAKERTLNTQWTISPVCSLATVYGLRHWGTSRHRWLSPSALPPKEVPGTAKQRLLLTEFTPTGNELVRLEEARKRRSRTYGQFLGC